MDAVGADATRLEMASAKAITDLENISDVVRRVVGDEEGKETNMTDEE